MSCPDSSAKLTGRMHVIRHAGCGIIYCWECISLWLATNGHPWVDDFGRAWLLVPTAHVAPPSAEALKAGQAGKQQLYNVTC